ncbi:MAG: hypothetical protein R2752_00170 [Vicinamibacterales bacterium]
MSAYPERIVCLTEETTETLYLIGAGDRVVGVSGYTVRRPGGATVPRVSAFLHALREDSSRCDRTSSSRSTQADLAAELIRRGCTVVTFNRDVAEIRRGSGCSAASWASGPSRTRSPSPPRGGLD